MHVKDKVMFSLMGAFILLDLFAAHLALRGLWAAYSFIMKMDMPPIPIQIYMHILYAINSKTTFIGAG